MDTLCAVPKLTSMHSSSNSLLEEASVKAGPLAPDTADAHGEYSKTLPSPLEESTVLDLVATFCRRRYPECARRARPHAPRSFFSHPPSRPYAA